MQNLKFTFFLHGESTKPATIAFYELARTYLVPLLYVQEATRRLKWLISKNDIMREVGLTA